jgi:predicted ester cyclase
MAGATGLTAAALGATHRTAFAQDATPATCPETTPEENMELARRFLEEALNEQNLDLLDELLTDDHVFHFDTRIIEHSGDTPAPHNADTVAFFEKMFEFFPDFHVTIDDIFAIGDKVAVRATETGTHQGDYPVSGVTVAPTGRSFEILNVEIFRIECGQIAERWLGADILLQLRQLGIITDDELTNPAGEPAVATPTS